MKPLPSPPKKGGREGGREKAVGKGYCMHCTYIPYYSCLKEGREEGRGHTTPHCEGREEREKESGKRRGHDRVG